MAWIAISVLAASLGAISATALLVVAFGGDKMELRRGKNDIWSGRPGEMHLSMTGRPGGSWEDRGNRHLSAGWYHPM